MAAADGTRLDPFRGFNFIVTCNKIKGAIGFQKVSGLEMAVAVSKYREGNDINTERKLPGLAEYPNVVLSRGLATNQSIVQWFQEIVNLGLESGLSEDAVGSGFRDDLTITVRDRKQRSVRVYKVRNTWPASLKLAELNAESSDVLIETLELANEGISVEFSAVTGVALTE